MEASQIFWIEILGEPAVDKFYKVSVLPDQLVQSQLDFIPEAIESYETSIL
jgi:hypothetical protein